MKIKNISADGRDVPALGRFVLPGAVVETDNPTAFTCQVDVWAPADKDAEKAHAEWLKTQGITAPVEDEEE